MIQKIQEKIKDVFSNKNNRKTIILAGVLVVLVLSYFVNFSGTSADLSWPLLEKEITRVTLTKGARKIELLLKDSKWIIQPEGYVADAALVDTVLKVVKDARDFEIVTSHPVYEKFELSDSEAVQIAVLNGDEALRTFSIGKGASTYRHTFVRLPNDEKVYQTEGYFRNDVDKEKNDLRDKKIISVLQADVMQLTLVNEKGARKTLKKQFAPPSVVPDTNAAAAPAGDTWVDDGDKTVKTDEINDILNVVSGLTASSFIDSSRGILEKEKALYTCAVKTISRDITLTILKEKDGDNYRAWSTERTYGFVISQFDAEKIMKDFSVLY